MRLLRLRVRLFLLLLAGCLGAASAIVVNPARADSEAAGGGAAVQAAITQVSASVPDDEGYALSDALKAELFAIAAFALLARMAHHSARKAHKSAQRSG
jgi:hypothetical protein